MGDAEPSCLSDGPSEGFGGELVGECFADECDGFEEEKEEDEGESGDGEEVEDFAEDFVGVAFGGTG